MLQDLSGPKIRTGTLAGDEPLRLQPGDELTIAVGDFAGVPGRVSTTYADLPKSVQPGDTLLLDDGRIQLRVEARARRLVLHRAQQLEALLAVGDAPFQALVHLREPALAVGRGAEVHGRGRAVGDLLSGTSDQLFYRRIGDLLTGQEARGASVDLTIDPKVQSAAWKALGDRKGAVAAIDPKTGEIVGTRVNPLVGLSVARRFLGEEPMIALSTAHPAKFEGIVEPLVGHAVPPPAALAECLARPASADALDADDDALRAVLLP